ncbi:DUF397 domain-containing protein [Streptomyces ipomoeae]|uniref:DUF397 domain-containing protein n=1 Tax=Streptomyces ipomoeae TaxID=103232 RepID=UPI0011466046|nr:DUF397 domain-containing protein [Streptomyces ipomoeae]MDX2936859.1 DUF397 domain-containing protein [Streptomyces ipomoeae]TQE23882.1 DUF397 domain-containing protein [Streptomyces ipomoeae]
MTPELIGPFQKSSYSGGQGDCVEVAPTSTGGRAIRDSKNPHGPLLHLTPTGWHTFLAGAKDGRFDQ